MSDAPQISYPWSTRELSYKKTFSYLTDRMNGKITSLITPWPRLNAIGVNGWEWGSAIAFCARPGWGKSVLVDQLKRSIYKLNPHTKMRILSFDLEMLAQVTAIREFSSVLGKTYAYLCSAEEEILIDDLSGPTGHKRKLTKQELLKCWEYVQGKLEKTETGDLRYPEDIIETSPTVKEFETIVHLYMETYKNPDGSYVNTLVTIDHLRLLKKENNQSEQEMLYDAAITINRLKKQYGYPIIFVALNHLVRDVNSDARTEDGKHSNYLRDSDIFGADAIMQNFDVVVVMDRPAARKITKYGPQMYIIDDEYILVFQYVKVRNGVPGMAFFRGEFNKMQIVEIDTPQRATVRAAENRQAYNQKQQSQTKINM